MESLNPVILAIPVFFILMSLEVVYDYFQQRKLYRLNDAVSNISCGIVEQLTGLFAKIFTVAAYHFVFTHFALFTLEDTWYWLVLAFLGVDFFYYWAHRMSHQVNLFWLGHVVHHQSEDYNLSVALRQSTFQKMFTFYFYFPMALMGFKTEWFVLMGAFNLLYQFWIHTEVIKKMPRWFEYIFNTPAHHRVHHGRDPKYIDKNHAGTLIIWDRMFGTFQEEEETPTYGITTPLNTFNPVMANVKPFINLWHEVKSVPGFWNKVKLVWMPPGWYPATLGGYRPPKPVDKTTYQKYDVAISPGLNWYLLIQYIMILAITSLFLFNTGHPAMTTALMLLIAAYVVLAVMLLGMVFEDRKRALFASGFGLGIFLVVLGLLPWWSLLLFAFWSALSLTVLQRTGFHQFVPSK